MARALLAAGAHPAVRADSEKGGLAAIHYAAARGAVAVVRLLLQQPGANANARDEVRPSFSRVLTRAAVPARGDSARTNVALTNNNLLRRT